MMRAMSCPPRALVEPESLPVALHYLQAMAGFARGSGVEWHLGLFLNPKVAIVLAVAVVGSARTTGRSLASRHNTRATAVRRGVFTFVALRIAVNR